MSGNPNQASAAGEAIFIPLLAIILVGGLWFLLHEQILLVCFYASFFMFGAYEHLGWLLTDNQMREIMGARQAIPSIDITRHGFGTLMMLAKLHGYVLRLILLPLMLWWGWRSYRKVVRFKFRRQISNVYDLIEIQARHFPASAIIKGKDLLARHPYIGPWATYALPLDFALDNQVLLASRTALSTPTSRPNESMMRIPPLTPDQKKEPFPIKRKMMPHYRYVCFDVDKANEVFAGQLGPLWKGVDALPPLEKALFAALCAQAAGDQEVCWQMIEQLGFSWREGTRDEATGKLKTPHHANTQGTDELLKKYASRQPIRDIINTHAHKHNVMFAVLTLARKKGKLTHANFLWLKPVNRGLWYTLISQGGQVPYWEAAGPWAHYQVESWVGKKLTTPQVAGAVYSLLDTMSREHWIDPGDYSEEHQRRMVIEANEKLEAEIMRSSGNKPPRNNAPAPSSYRSPNKSIHEDDEP